VAEAAEEEEVAEAEEAMADSEEEEAEEEEGDPIAVVLAVSFLLTLPAFTPRWPSMPSNKPLFRH
jgi:hypothetical protein